jgi:hypothetical protein
MQIIDILGVGGKEKRKKGKKEKREKGKKATGFVSPPRPLRSLTSDLHTKLAKRVA